MPICEIAEIRDNILPSDKLIRKYFSNHFHSEEVKNTNCYGFSLGIEHPSVRFNPGFTLGCLFFGWMNPSEELLEDCKSDLQNLNFSFREIGLDTIDFVEETVYFFDACSKSSNNSYNLPYRNPNLSYNPWDELLSKNEYLVKIFYTPCNPKLSYGDFHFVRQDRETGIWFHKLGWYRPPEILQSDKGFPSPTPGKEPTKFTAVCSDGFTYHYEPIGYFAITEFS